MKLIKRLNNKGLSVVEVIVVFAVLMVLVTGMLNVVVALKGTSEDLKFNKDIVEFSSLLNKTIHDDLIKRKFTNISNCSATDIGAAKILTECRLNFEVADSNGLYKLLSINLTDKEIKYGTQTYALPDKEIFEFSDNRIVYHKPVDTGKHPLDTYIEYDDTNKILVINIQYNVIDARETSYGFKIVHTSKFN